MIMLMVVMMITGNNDDYDDDDDDDDDGDRLMIIIIMMTSELNSMHSQALFYCTSKDTVHLRYSWVSIIIVTIEREASS